MNNRHYDVIIAGAGMAGLTLARHLLLDTNKTILLVDKRTELPGPSQKVGESLVQLSGFYLSKVLDLTEHLMTEHYLKYNLRFHWNTPGAANTSIEDLSVSFIRLSSNIPTFQLDRNVFEAHLIEVNSRDPRFQLQRGVRNLNVELADEGPHRVAFDGGEATCDWFVDSTGRSGLLKRKLSLAQENPIRHGSTWCWVDGLVDIERLSGRPVRDMRGCRTRMQTGHMPFFLATNHFCAEGRWFWVIPLHGKTSLGLVFDHAVLDPQEVSTARKLIDYVCRQWPALARDLPHRKIVDEGRYHSFSYDATQTISPQRWALSGEAGRFSDPLYSPGSDLISIHNTLIVDAIKLDDPARLAAKSPLYEQIMRVMYESYVPSYSISYNCLGDQEAFALKYGWELAVYFGFFVVPVINDLLADPRFMKLHLRKYALLGPINKNLQMLLSAFYQWKKANQLTTPVRTLVDFYRMTPLRQSETLFYKVGLTHEEAEEVFDEHTARLREFARFIIAHVYASVLGDARVLTNGPFVAGLKLRETVFDPEQMRAAYAPYAESTEQYPWTLDPLALVDFVEPRPVPQEVV
jgi:2-polyprenyl-6-methoxyphenol hydroxylase-like FAD-dependent oxidoreductase